MHPWALVHLLNDTPSLPPPTPRRFHSLSFLRPCSCTTYQLSESDLRQQAAIADIHERSARASVLSLAVARAFCEGRERFRAAQALASLRDAARARRRASAAGARITALRLSRYLRAWSDGARRARRRAAALSSAVSFAAESAAHDTQGRATGCLRQWAAIAARRGRRKRDVLVAVGRLRARRQRAAVRAWRDVCRERNASAVIAQTNSICVRRASVRRGLQRWRRVVFGKRVQDGGAARRVWARLVDVAVKVDEAAGRRRARKALQDWHGRARGARRREEAEM